MPRVPSRVPSPWLALVPGLVLVLLGVRAVVAETRAAEDRARETARAAAGGVVRTIGLVAREFTRGLPAAGATTTAEEALAAARHLSPRFLADPLGRPLRDAGATREPTDADRAFLRDAVDAAARLGDDVAGREAAAALLATTAATLPDDAPRAPWLVLADAWLDGVPGAPGFDRRETLDRYEDVAADAEGWGDATRDAVLARVDELLAPRSPPPLRAIRARADAVRDAVARLGDGEDGATAWMTPQPDGVSMGVVSAQVGLAEADGATTPARIVGEVPARVLRERLLGHVEQVVRDGKVSVVLVAPGGRALARHPDAPPERPVAVSVPLEPPFEAWRVEVVADSEAGVPGTVFALAAAVVATAAGLVWGVLALRRAAREHARAADERQSFLDHVAHEVRTPAGAMLALSEELAGGRVAPARQAQYHAHLAEEARRLARLVEDTLDLSRLDAGRLVLDLKETDLRGVVAEGLQAAGAEGRVLVRAPSEPVPVLADAPALRRVVRNLVDNALRHGGASPPPEVTVAHDGRLARVAVRDHGRGIRAEHAAHVFDRFWRAPSVTHETKGVGVGLAICREVARAHGGDVTLDSAPGKGATFTLVLPSAGGRR